MAATFSVFEHYPIIGPNQRQIGQTQPGDLCQLYTHVASLPCVQELERLRQERAGGTRPT